MMIIVGAALGVLLLYIFTGGLKGWARPKIEEQFVATEKLIDVKEDYINEGIEKYSQLPDALNGQQVYIYKKLMKKWFRHLLGIHRFDEEKSTLIRNDWYDYLRLIREWRTQSFLAAEAKTEAQRERHSTQARKDQDKSEWIEDIFANQVGQAAVDALAEVRAISTARFHRSGDAIAPLGQWFLNDILLGNPEGSGKNTRSTDELLQELIQHIEATASKG